MPLYEYECDACGHRFEVIQKFSDPPVAVCRACGGTVRKLLSSPAIQFKGSGWYITDYARKGAAAGDANGGSSSAEAAGEKDGKTAKADQAGKPSGGESASAPSSKPSTADSRSPSPKSS